MKVPHFRIIDRRGDELINATVTSIDYISKNICYINEYYEEEVVPFYDKDCEIIEVEK